MAISGTIRTCAQHGCPKADSAYFRDLGRALWEAESGRSGRRKQKRRVNRCQIAAAESVS